ncbi:hypothetical protein Mag101_03450 [Microbulbifer agarilyticus]|uniref:Outer membrane protein n=1 Tax=Microbulbifer agarilyticus TaxID=260552 RepID=A0A1Q2M270_9GAMM|nr:TIGR04219 family outer membrane beta-barrel protein [Microbulbifer agarilyticus]AQQ66801.1 hypothetical protein Mag101_03450 [Microbulbifer agarilyticus]
MKFIKSTLALFAALASSAANADTVLGVDITAGAWQPTYNGEIFEFSSVDEYSKESNTFVQLALEHPFSPLPNVMLANSKIESVGESGLNKLDLSHTDATFYYEVLDNWVNLDLGLTARYFNGFYDGYTWLGNFTSSDPTFKGTVPMVYGSARFDLPFTGWSIIAQGNATQYDLDRFADLTAKVRWDFLPAGDLAIEAGYRTLTIDSSELDSLTLHVDAKGPYLGLNFHL